MRELLRQFILDSQSRPLTARTRRDVRLPGIAGKCIAVVGMRRSGKTTFLWQVLADRLAAGTSREGLLFFGFEDERLAGMKAGDLHLILDEFYGLHPQWRDGPRATFFFDEIQVVPGWESFVRRILDTESADLFISGSSARLLSREVATALRGRAMEALVYPFSLREYLRHSAREPVGPPERFPTAVRSAMDHALRDYLSGGGFPEAQGAEPRDRFDLLRGYVDLVLLRDIIERHQVSNPTALRWLTRHLLSNAAGHFSISRFHADLLSQGIPASRDSLHEFVAFLVDAFLVRTLSIATGSERRRIVNPRKVYPIDPGFIPVYDRTGRANLGHALETAVLLELDRRGAEVAYVRTAAGHEVDFLARYPEGGTELIQVCADLSAAPTREREFRGLLEAAAEHPEASLHLIALDPEDAASIVPAVNVHSAVSWLLGSAS